MGDCTDRACRCAAATSHAEPLVDDFGHQIAEACGCSSLCRQHQRGEVLGCEILLLLAALQEQVCHDTDIPDHLGSRCAAGDVHINFDDVTDRQVGFVLRLVLLSAACEPGDVAIAGASADCNDNRRLFSCLLNLFYCKFIINADGTLNERNIHLWDMAHIGKRQTVDEVCVFVQNSQEPTVVVCQRYKTASTSTHVDMAHCNLVCHRLNLLCFVSAFFPRQLFRSNSRRFLRRLRAGVFLKTLDSSPIIHPYCFQNYPNCFRNSF